jgi:hypothetical protein
MPSALPSRRVSHYQGLRDSSESPNRMLGRRSQSMNRKGKPTRWLNPVITKDEAMEIESTKFGNITIDGKAYEHDVVIRLSGEVVKRKKKLSKKYYGTSHVMSKDEAKFIFEKGCAEVIVGSGQMGNVHLSPEAEAYFAKKGCKVLLQPTPEAMHVFNKSHAKKIGLFHVTC